MVVQKARIFVEIFAFASLLLWIVVDCGLRASLFEEGPLRVVQLGRHVCETLSEVLGGSVEEEGLGVGHKQTDC